MQSPKMCVIVVALVAMSLSMLGCATTGLSKSIGAGNPIPQWEKELVKYYTDTVPLKSFNPGMPGPPKLRFIVDYENKFPQLSGIPPKCIKTNPKVKFDEKATFNEMDYDAYAAYRRDRLICELRAKQEALKVEDETLRLAMLEARLNLQEAEKKLLDVNGKKPEKEYEKIQASIEQTKAEIYKAHNVIKDAKIRSIDFDIERISNLGKSGEGFDKKYHLQAAGILELAKHERNRILGDLMVIARRVHDMKDNYLHYTRASINSFFDFTQIFASGFGSVAGSESTARALAAVATGSAAVQESFDSRFFYQHATTAVLSIMKKQRHEAEQVLVMNMNKDVLEYPLRVALADYAAFLLAGGLTDALTELGADAKVKEMRELEKLNELKQMSESRRQELQKRQEAVSEEETARKERQKAYGDLVDKALFGRIDSILNTAEREAPKTDQVEQ